MFEKLFPIDSLLWIRKRSLKKPREGVNESILKEICEEKENLDTSSLEGSEKIVNLLPKFLKQEEGSFFASKLLSQLLFIDKVLHLNSNAIPPPALSPPQSSQITKHPPNEIHEKNFHEKG